MWRGLLVIVASCGRLRFDPIGAAASDGRGGADGDGVTIDGLPSDLVVWFPLEDTMPTDVVSGGAGTCAGSACPMVVPGYRNNGLQFDGVDDCITIADYPALDQATLTLAIRAFMTTGAQDAACLAKRVDTAGGPQDTWEIGVGPTNDVELTSVHNSATEQIAGPDADVTLGAWHHFAITWDGTTKRIYLDGVQRVNSLGGGPLTYDTHAAYIGCDDNGGLVRFFKGTLDEMQIYKRALSATEVAALAM